MSNLPPPPPPPPPPPGVPPPPPGGAPAPPAPPTPAPPPPTAALPVVQPPGQARRRNWIIAGSIAIGTIVVAGILVLGAIGIDEELFFHDLLSADFSDDDDTFSTGEIADYRLEVRDGRYRLTATTSFDPQVAGPSVPPLEAFGFFARTAYNVDIQADVVAVDSGAQAVVGLECVHSASGGVAGARYVFTAGTGDEPYRLVFMPDRSFPNTKLAFGVVAAESGPPLRAGQRLGLQCNDRSITGLIDDTVVIAFGDPAIESFEAAGLTFWTDTKGDWVEFDNVTAVVPEH